MAWASFLAGPPGAGPPRWHQDGVGHRQVRGRVPVEAEHCLDCPAGHRRGCSRRARARNSSSAWATTAEIVRPEVLAYSRTAAASRPGSLTVNTTPGSGTATRPDAAAWST